MKIMFLKILAFHAILVSHGPHIRQCDLRGFLHDIAHLARHLELSISRHHIYLDLKRIAADAGPREPSYDSDLIVGVLEGNLLFSEIFLDVSLCDMHRFPFLLQELPGCLSADLTDPAL